MTAVEARIDGRKEICYIGEMLRRALLLLLLTYILFCAGDDPWQAQVQKFDRILALARDNYPDPIDEKSAVTEAVKGFLSSLDPHSYFLDSLALRSLLEDQSGNFFGIGIRVIKYEDRLTVFIPLKGMPAERAGILAGDIIEEIDGEPIGKLSMEEIMGKLRGKKGTDVEVKVRRDGFDSLLVFQMKREQIPLDSVNYAFILPQAPGIAYISVRVFGSRTSRELEEHLKRFEKQAPLKGLILDLRGNPGGVLESAVDMADLFLPKGKTILTVRGRLKDEVRLARRNGQFEKLPLVILISRSSASASEIVAAAVQDHRRGKIVGQRSWGKGLVESLHRVGNSSAVALTSARYYTPADRSLQRDYSSLEEYYRFAGIDDYDHDRSVRGGVIPDFYVAPDSYSTPVYNLVRKGVFFSFARRWISENEGRNEINTIDAGIIDRFRNYLTEEKIEMDDQMFQTHMEEISLEIERQLVSNLVSPEAGLEAAMKGDTPVMKALALLQQQVPGASPK